MIECTQDSPESLTLYQLHLLQDAQVFGRMSVYGGILPLRLVAARDPADIETLVRSGYLEQKNLCLTCGTNAVGLALTAKGRETLRALEEERPGERERENA